MTIFLVEEPTFTDKDTFRLQQHQRKPFELWRTDATDTWFGVHPTTHTKTEGTMKIFALG